VSEKQRHYDPDRLIGAANMFDILPASAVPDDVLLSPEITQARAQSRALFKSLSPAPERDSILSALGRLGKPALKHKVRYRAQKLVAIGNEWFPDLYTVTDEAVNCLNYYVHGTTSSFDYDRNFDLVTFFTNTLEFVFAVSDLIEAGWDFRAWAMRGTTMSHPFGSYRVNYRFGLGRLRETVTKAEALAEPNDAR
jgi:ApeA N-terminal domain 1